MEPNNKTQHLQNTKANKFIYYIGILSLIAAVSAVTYLSFQKKILSQDKPLDTFKTNLEFNRTQSTKILNKTPPSPIDSIIAQTSHNIPVDTSLDNHPLHPSAIRDLHIIGVYKGDDGIKNKPWWKNCKDPSNSTSTLECHAKYASVTEVETVTINANLSSPATLVLMAYEPVKWRIKSNQLSFIKEIILAGYHAQSITNIPHEIPIQIRTHDSSPTCPNCTKVLGYFRTHKRSSSSFKKTIQHIEKITGLTTTTFQGNYEEGSFIISKNTIKLKNLGIP